MKLISANINNFRLLKNLKLNFSIDKNKSLTVIRAENETGKTTCLNALTWCLYGSNSLPNKGDYVLFPSDELKKEKVSISVEIEFELEHIIKTNRDIFDVKKSTYRMHRVCIENSPLAGKAKRSPDEVTLYEVTNNGVIRVLDSDVPSIIEKALPQSLKDVYFTDGDSAMSFIEAGANTSVKRRRVTNAIESLLGLKILDNTVKHLTNVSNRFSKEIDNKDYAKELEILSDRIASNKEDIEDHQEKLDESKTIILDIEKEIAKKEIEVENALKLGDKEALTIKQKRINNDIIRTDNTVKEAYKSLISIISSQDVSRGILSNHIKKSNKFLNDMNNIKQLPQVNIPILKDLINKDNCFCGSDLSDDTKEGKERKSRINKLIQESQESDKVQKTATNLFFRLKDTNTDTASSNWKNSYSSQYTIVQNTLKSLSDLKHDAEKIEALIDDIGDSQLQIIRDQLTNLRRTLQQAHSTQDTSSHFIESLQISLREHLVDLEKVRNKIGKTDNSTIRWDISDLAKGIFIKVIDKLRQEELSKVSYEMNRIFLAMIGADVKNPDFGLIQSAELTKDFDIVVYGPNKHLLSPDQDLNGASRRAITLAFILALTKVSEVEAPNIIDTPLGMMSGFVKQSVLLRTIEEGSQAILFLTPSEIRGVEAILDKYAGVIFTLTNPAHYPRMLVHKPDENCTGVTRCECDHYSHCNICERKIVEVI